MVRLESWQNSRVSGDGTHHATPKGPLYRQRFEQVLPFNFPGLAPAKENGKWFHIQRDGTPAYPNRFDLVFGFYDGRASVEDQGNWFHILPSGKEAYRRRFSWCGNYQQDLCVVRDHDGNYFHIDLDGRDAYAERYLYVGDFREEIAVARRKDGLCMHIQSDGRPLNDQVYIDLGVYHKGYATAKDEFGWFHIDKAGTPLYEQRYLVTEPFYNGLALCTSFNGSFVRVNLEGKEVEHIDPKIPPETGRKILLIGNLSSGKTMLGKELVRRTNLKLIRIGDCRRQMADGSMSGEYRAWTKFMQFCESPKGCILEFSGGGPHVYNVAHALEASLSETYVIWLDASLDECLSNSKRRVFDSPYPYSMGNLAELIEHIDEEIKTAWNDVWTKRNFKTLRIVDPRKNALRQSLTFLGEDD